jgi:outer membrane murein-binding lipoprotein Lpp
MDAVALRIMEPVGPMAIVLLAVLAGILFNNSKLDKLESRLDARINSLESRVNAGFDRMQADMAQFYRILGQHDSRLNNLEKK